MGLPENTDWEFDYGMIEDIPVPGGDLPSLDPPALSWPPSAFAVSFRKDFAVSSAKPDHLKETGSQKRMSSESYAYGSKAGREKMRRDKLNDRFMELNSILNHGRLPKIDKSAILGDAVRTIAQLRDEAKKLKESNEKFLEKVNKIKVEKNELRDEKQRLKEAKEKLELKLKGMRTQPSFPLNSGAIPATFSCTSQLVGGKLVPVIGYPGVSMWQFMPPAAVDTTFDHVLRPPVA